VAPSSEHKISYYDVKRWAHFTSHESTKPDAAVAGIALGASRDASIVIAGFNAQDSCFKSAIYISKAILCVEKFMIM
jgi:hypothetical protein